MRKQYDSPENPRVLKSYQKKLHLRGDVQLLRQATLPLRTHERTLGMTLAAGLLGVSVLGTRHPHLLAWPLATVGGLAGGLGLLRATRQQWSGRVPEDPGR